MKRLIAYSALAILIIIAALQVYIKIPYNNATKTTAEFFSLMAENKINSAENLTTGYERYQIEKNEKIFTKAQDAELTSISFKNCYTNWNISEIYSRVIVHNIGGDYSVNWYRISLINSNGSWKIINVTYSEPFGDAGVVNFGLSAADENKITSTFDHYRFDVEHQEYLQSEKYLSGMALISQVQSDKILDLHGKSSSYTPENINFKLSWNSKDMAQAVLSYKFDSKNVSSLATFFKLPDGWKIVGLVNY